MSEEHAAAPEGWYPDPQGLADERYWDGSNWTEETKSKPAFKVPAKAYSDLKPHDPVALATMEYLHSVSLVLIAGVVAGLLTGFGLIWTIVLDSPVVAGITFFVAAISGIVLLVSSIVALVRGDMHKSRIHK